ncbi:MAG: arginine--tRNA ligase [Gemmatimonadota bacterium]
MTEVRSRSSGQTALLRELERVLEEIGGPPGFEPVLERPRDPQHGDYATNAALVLARGLGTPPRVLAERIARAFDRRARRVATVEVAGPGFLNFRVADALIWEEVASILAADRAWGRSRTPEPEKVNVEFVSANPTGPLHVAHGRGAALGDAIASLLEWTGHEVSREFYVNDAGRQVDLLAESIEARFQERRGIAGAVPEGGYHGEYVAELADEIAEREGPSRLESMHREERLALFRDRAVAALREGQERDLERFGVKMDVFRRESDLYSERRIESVLRQLEAEGLTYERDGAVWLKTAELGDEKDRVLVKRDGSYTYFAPDIGYHVDKAERGFDRAIDIWGADHHSHVRRMQAALSALGLPDFLEVVILQLVRVLRAGVEAKMSKRAGTFVALRELLEETGRDVARYFFLMRRAEAQLNFDLDLALDTSEANPVYRVQYAHARMCSVFARGQVDVRSLSATRDGLERLDTEAERRVAKALLRFPEVVRSAAEARAPHQVCTYLEETANLVNGWYHEGNLNRDARILAEGPTRNGRLKLARATQITLRNGLGLLGLDAPRAMLRDEGERKSGACQRTGGTT